MEVILHLRGWSREARRARAKGRESALWHLESGATKETLETT